MRATAFFLVLLLLSTPLLLLTGTALADSTAWVGFQEAGRIGTLLFNTFALATLAIIFAVPVSTLAAFTLERLAVPGARYLRGVVLVWLFVPLPVVAVAWQVILGSWLPSLALEPGAVAWRPWSQGLLPAGFVHGLAALPWVIVIVSAGLRNTDRALEEEALVNGGPMTAIRLVLLPRAGLAALAACALVAVQVSTEIPITDAMMVRTFAEEAYTQIVGMPAGVNSAVLLSIPVLFISSCVAMLAVRRMSGKLPANPEAATTPREFRVSRRLKSIAVIAVYLLFTVSAALPFAALAWKCGGIEQLTRVVRVNGFVILQSLATAGATGLLTAWLATALAWSARTSPVRRTTLQLFAVLLALTPGPILGQGLKDLILMLVGWENSMLPELEFPPLKTLLYDQPSPVPSILAGILRWLPIGLLVVAPVMRTLSRDLLEKASIDGVSAWKYVGRPGLARATHFAVIAVAGLALGEVSASKLVAPPGWRMFILDLFDQMHYGAEPRVAALCLVQITMSALLLVLWRCTLRS